MRLDIKLQSPRNRQRYKETSHSDRVASVLAKSYNTLSNEFVKGEFGNYGSMSYEDIFHEAILYVIQDETAFNLSEQDIIAHFKYRYNMVKFQIIQDSKLLSAYANYPQTKEE